MTNFDKGHAKDGLNADANLISAILGSMQNIREKDIEAAYALSATAAEPTLDQVNSGNVADVSQTMYMAYDEGGQRIWTAFRGAGVDEEFATMPGVGKYYAQHVSNDVGFTLTQMDLVAGGFRDVKSGVAYYPVTDMQGNVRAYASTGGLNGAIDYYAYGTSSEIVHGNVEDNKRWQGKEEDGSIHKLYFGSRYFDPFFGMWLTPDPAGQFANPYTYGGDPVNYVDPNGEWVHIVIGAVVGSIMGTVNAAIQCTAPGGGGGNCAKNIYIQSRIGGAVGALTAATGGAVGGGLLGGFVGGAVGGAGGYAGSYVGQKAIGMDAEWDKYEFIGSIWKGALSGSAGAAGSQLFSRATGALVGGFGGGAVGSWGSGEDKWGILKGGLMGAGMGLISYAAKVHVAAKNDYMANEAARKSVSDEIGVSIDALDDLYVKQSNITDPTQEYYINENSSEAKIIPMETTIEPDGSERIVGHMPGGMVQVHGHGEGTHFSSTGKGGTGPSGLDLLSAAEYPERKNWVLDATNGQIHNFNGNGLETSSSSYWADRVAEQKTNITKTLQYVQKFTYEEYYGNSWSW